MQLVRDITEHKQLEAQLARHAAYDNLTGLPNRRVFADRLAQVTSRRGGEEVRGAVFFLDLDGFKAVNDGLGHAAGDQLLQVIAQRMQSTVRPEDTVARFGGDEFLVLVEGVQARADVERLAGRILAHLSMPVELDGRSVIVTGSVGITWVTAKARAVDLLHQADTALYEVKAAGKKGFAWYTRNERAAPRHLAAAPAILLPAGTVPEHQAPNQPFVAA